MIGRLASLKTTYQKGTISNTLLYTATQLVTLSVSASNQVEDRLTHSVSVSRSLEQVDYFVDADNSVDYKFTGGDIGDIPQYDPCLLYTSPSPRDGLLSRMPSSA